MKHLIRHIILLCGLPLLLAGCMEWDYGDAVEDFNATGAGLFITNEGNFQYGNATLSYYDPETQQMGTVRTPWVKRNHRKAFWQTGYTLVNSIAIDGSSEKSAVRLSLTYTQNEWIMPNTGFNRILSLIHISEPTRPY